MDKRKDVLHLVKNYTNSIVTVKMGEELSNVVKDLKNIKHSIIVNSGIINLSYNLRTVASSMKQ